MHLYSELGSVRTANSCDDCSALSSWEFVDVRLVDPKSMLLYLTSRPVKTGQPMIMSVSWHVI